MNGNLQAVKAAEAAGSGNRTGLPSEFDCEDIKSVRKMVTAAVHQFGLPTHFVDDIESDVILNWFNATSREDLSPVRDYKAWLFVSAKNCAWKIQSQLSRSRFVALEDADVQLALFSSFDVDGTPNFDPALFLAAMERLYTIIQTANFNQTAEDRLIFERRTAGIKFDQIAEELNMSQCAVRRRWYRFLEGLADDIFEEAKCDSVLATALPSIVKDVESFHRSVLAFTSAMSHGGFAAVKEAAEFIIQNA